MTTRGEERAAERDRRKSLLHEDEIPLGNFFTNSEECDDLKKLVKLRVQRYKSADIFSADRTQVIEEILIEIYDERKMVFAKWDKEEGRWERLDKQRGRKIISSRLYNEARGEKSEEHNDNNLKSPKRRRVGEVSCVQQVDASLTFASAGQSSNRSSTQVRLANIQHTGAETNRSDDNAKLGRRHNANASSSTGESSTKRNTERTSINSPLSEKNASQPFNGSNIDQLGASGSSDTGRVQVLTLTTKTSNTSPPQSKKTASTSLVSTQTTIGNDRALGLILDGQGKSGISTYNRGSNLVGKSSNENNATDQERSDDNQTNVFNARLPNNHSAVSPFQQNPFFQGDVPINNRVARNPYNTNHSNNHCAQPPPNAFANHAGDEDRTTSGNTKTDVATTNTMKPPAAPENPNTTVITSDIGACTQLTSVNVQRCKIRSSDVSTQQTDRSMSSFVDGSAPTHPQSTAQLSSSNDENENNSNDISDNDSFATAHGGELDGVSNSNESNDTNEESLDTSNSTSGENRDAIHHHEHHHEHRYIVLCMIM